MVENMEKFIESIKNKKAYLLLIPLYIIFVIAFTYPLKYRLLSILVLYNMKSYFILMNDALNTNYKNFHLKFLLSQIFSSFLIILVIYIL